MLDKHFGKIVIIFLIIIIIIFAVMFYNSNQKNQQNLQDEIQSLKQQVTEQESNYKKDLLESQKLAEQEVARKLLAEKELLEKQQQLNQSKGEKLDEKLDKNESVVTVLEKQRQQDSELRKQQEKISKQALSAAYLSQGLQMASAFKMYVAEYYVSEGKFPDNNEQLGLPDAKSYDSDYVRSIWVSKGGKITIVYKQIAGQDKGAISLIPNEKNNIIHWKCVTRDFKSIQQLFPQCHYSSSQ